MLNAIQITINGKNKSVSMNKFSENNKKRKEYLKYFTGNTPTIKTSCTNKPQKQPVPQSVWNESSYEPSLLFINEQLKRKEWEDDWKQDEDGEKPKRSVSVFEGTCEFHPLVVKYGQTENMLDEYGQIHNIKLESKFKPKYFLTAKGLLDYRKIDMLRKLYALCKFYSRVRGASPDDVTVLPMAQTQFALVRLFGSQVNVSNVIDCAKKTGLIVTQNERYYFVSETTIYKEFWKENSKSKTYFYFKNVEDELLDFCKEHRVSPWTEKDNPVPAVFELPDYIKSRITISPHIKGVVKPDIISVSEFESSVRKILEEKYPEYNEIQNLIKEVNSCPFYRTHPELQMKGEFSIRIKGNRLRKVGFRVTNRACSVSKEEKDNQIYKSREIMLNALKLNGTHHDVRSSIPKVMYLLSHGKWLPQSADIYEMIFESMKKSGSTSLKNYSTFTAPLRELFKTAFMTVNFSKSEKEASRSLSRRILTPRNKSEVESRNYFKDEYTDEYKTITEGTKNFIHTFVTEYRNAVSSVIGFTSSSDIFLYESLIYLKTLKTLLKCSNAFECYDAFYLNKNIDSEVIETMIEENALSTYRNLKETVTFDRYVRTFSKSQTTVYVHDGICCSDGFKFTEKSFYSSITSLSESLAKVQLKVYLKNNWMEINVRNNIITVKNINNTSINSSKNEIIEYITNMIKMAVKYRTINNNFEKTGELKLESLVRQALAG